MRFNESKLDAVDVPNDQSVGCVTFGSLFPAFFWHPCTINLSQYQCSIGVLGAGTNIYCNYSSTGGLGINVLADYVSVNKPQTVCLVSCRPARSRAVLYIHDQAYSDYDPIYYSIHE